MPRKCPPRCAPKPRPTFQTERDRLRREMDIAKDQAIKELWEQAAQLATLISAKAIGRSLTEDDHHRLLDEAMQEMRHASKTLICLASSARRWPPVRRKPTKMEYPMSEPKEQFADVSAKRLATIYAEALLNAAEAANDVPQVLEEIDSLVDDVFARRSASRAHCSSAPRSDATRHEAIEKAFADRASRCSCNVSARAQ